MNRIVTTVALAIVAVGLYACQAERSHAKSSAASEKKGALVSIDGLSSRAPADWIEVPTRRQFRYKQFRLPRKGGDRRDAELIIYYFGAGGGGGIEANLKRWMGMFKPPAGKRIEEVAKVDKFKVGNVSVTVLDVSGTYMFKSRPFAAEAEPRPNHRMIAVIFESPKGPYYFRFVGPANTVAHYKPAFDQWLKNFK